MNKRSQQAVHNIVGVITQQLRGLSVEENYDALDELNDLVQDKFAGAKNDMGQEQVARHSLPIAIDIDVVRKRKDAPAPLKETDSVTTEPDEDEEC